MESSLLERVNLLLHSNQIDQQVYDLMPGVVRKVEDELKLRLTKDNAGSFVTHTAIALSRIKNHEPMGEFPPDWEALVAKQPTFFRLAKEILSTVEADNVDTDAEAAIITLHFYVLTGEEPE